MNEIVVFPGSEDRRSSPFPSHENLHLSLSLSLFSLSSAVGLVIGAIYNCTRKRGTRITIFSRRNLKLVKTFRGNFGPGGLVSYRGIVSRKSTKSSIDVEIVESNTLEFFSLFPVSTSPLRTKMDGGKGLLSPPLLPRRSIFSISSRNRKGQRNVTCKRSIEGRFLREREREVFERFEKSDFSRSRRSYYRCSLFHFSARMKIGFHWRDKREGGKQGERVGKRRCRH